MDRHRDSDLDAYITALEAQIERAARSPLALAYCRICQAWHSRLNKECVQRQRQAVKDTFRGMGV